MGIRLKLVFCLLVLLFFSLKAFAQVAPKVEAEEEATGLMEKRIEEAISRAPFRAGAFFVQPKLNIFGGYDSNSLLVANEVDSDFGLRADPGLVAFLPFHKRALLEINDELNFIYYRDTEDLRGVFNTVGARFTIGGNRVLFTVGDTFSARRTGATQEFDFPTDQQNNNFDSSLTLGLGKKSEANLGVVTYSTVITQEIVNPTDVPLSQFYDQQNFRVIGGFRRYVSAYTSFIVDSYYENWNFEEGSVQPDADIFAVQGGFSFQAKGNITGEAVLGYMRMVPDVADLPEFSGLIGRGAVQVRVGERTTLGLEYTRDARPSVTDNNWFFIEGRVAPSVEFFITREFSIYGSIGFERNSYPLPGLIVTSTGEVVPGEVDDSAVESNLSIRYRFRRIWEVYGTAGRLNRNSNAPNSEKERNVFALGMQIVY